MWRFQMRQKIWYELKLRSCLDSVAFPVLTTALAPNVFGGQSLETDNGTPHREKSSSMRLLEASFGFPCVVTTVIELNIIRTASSERHEGRAKHTGRVLETRSEDI
jgi:hypothetical protein